MTAKDAALQAKLPEQVTADNHAWVMDAILGKPKVAIKTIGILVYDGVNDLDFMGPRYVLGQAGAKTQLIGIKAGPIKTVMGVQVVPDTTIDDVKQLDILVVPGGFTGTIEAAYDRKVLDWIRAIDKTTTYTAAVCTGGWILGATGLLEGKRATTNWYRREEFLKKYKAIPTNERYVHDGKYWTAAGVTAGLDMSLAILNDNWGEKVHPGRDAGHGVRPRAAHPRRHARENGLSGALDDEGDVRRGGGSLDREARETAGQVAQE